MTAAPAQYYHATLYQFGKEARDKVIADFNATLQNVSAHVWYDVELAIFNLTCPTEMGPHADEALQHVISRYVEVELAEADSDNRPSRIHHFAAGDEDHPDITQDGPMVTEATSSSRQIENTKRSPPVVLHLVSTGEASTANVKLFTIRQLPKGLLERTLASLDSKSRKIIVTNLTCRAVRWSTSQEEYIFNGRVGDIVITNGNATKNVLNLATFIDINRNTSAEHEDAQELAEQPAYFNFQGTAPTMKQFIEGQGEIELEHPETRSEAPKDALKFNVQEGVWSKGRIRVVRDATESSEASNSDDDADDASTDGNANRKIMSFTKLLKNDGQAARHDFDIGIENEESENATPRPAFRSLFSGAEPAGMTNAVGTAQQLPVPLDNTLSAALPVRKPGSEADSCAQPPSANFSERTRTEIDDQNEQWFPNHSRFAEIDTMGLRSKAANQASWEAENPSPRKNKVNRSGVARRAPSQQASIQPSSSYATTTSQDTGPTIREYRQSPARQPLAETESLSTTTSSSPFKSQPVKAWTNKINQPRTPSSRLIDDSAPSTPSRMQPPPGFDYQAQQKAQQKAVLAKQKCKDVSGFGMLIDFGEESSEDVENIGRLSTRTLNDKEPQFKDNMDGNLIDERLQVDDHRAGAKQCTMRQKAKKKANNNTPKNKGKGTPGKESSKQPVPKAQLPKPSPPPPPPPPAKKKSPVKQDQASESVSQDGKSSTACQGIAQSTSNPANATKENGQKKLELVPEDFKGLERLLNDVSVVNDMSSAEMIVRLGLVLTERSQAKEHLDGVYTTDVIERKLNKASIQTTFIPRLTTSEDDAWFMLSLAGTEDPKGSVEYEMHIKNSEGGRRLVKFDQKELNGYMVFLDDTTIGTAYIHNPIRVWDAQASINKPQADLSITGAVAELISSVQTSGDAPSFRVMVPTRAFTVETVYVRRRFEKSVGNGITFSVTEVQELILDSVASRKFNLKATSGERDYMIEHQRLWWECALYADVSDSTTAPAKTEQLQELAECMLTKIDGVGYENKGPFVWAEIEEPAATEIPFW